MKIYRRKTKDFSKPCPNCSATMEFDIVVVSSHFKKPPKLKEKYYLMYDCPNDCKLPFEEWHITLETNEKIIWYEEEEIE
jgi:hypothetical protein